MKSIIIYFSQTGNTEKVARAIQSGVKQAADHCDLVKMKDANPRHLSEYDLIGLGSPVFGAEPANVSDFINNMRFVGGKHVFAFSTHGTKPEFFPASVYPKLKSRGLVVIGFGDWYGSVWISTYPKPYLTDGHPDDIDLKEARVFGVEMVERSRRIAAGETNIIPPPPPAPPPLALPEWTEKTFESMLKYHAEKCKYPQCRLCMDNCPVDGIDLSVTPPVIAKPCIICDFCTKICPTGAMDGDDYFNQYAAWWFDEMQTNLVPQLAKDEAEGRFRRIVPIEEIKPDTPFFKVHNKHPRWIIGKGPV